MSTTNYEGRFLTIKSTGKLARVQRVATKRGTHGLSSRFIVLDEDQAMHELMPHEIDLKEEGFTQESDDATSANQYDNFISLNDEVEKATD